MSVKYTERKWKLEKNVFGEPLIMNEKGRVFGKAFVNERTDENAKLMAAAPELLSAFNKYVSSIPQVREKNTYWYSRTME